MGAVVVRTIAIPARPKTFSKPSHARHQRLPGLPSAVSPSSAFVVQTKGMDHLDVPIKMARRAHWCSDLNRAQGEAVYGFVHVMVRTVSA